MRCDSSRGKQKSQRCKARKRLSRFRHKIHHRAEHLQLFRITFASCTCILQLSTARVARVSLFPLKDSVPSFVFVRPIKVTLGTKCKTNQERFPWVGGRGWRSQDCSVRLGGCCKTIMNGSNGTYIAIAAKRRMTVDVGKASL